MLTDEKILGTVHIAVGDNEMLGGVNDVEPALGPAGHGPTVDVDGRPAASSTGELAG